jgi:hypothetical protein
MLMTTALAVTKGLSKVSWKFLVGVGAILWLYYSQVYTPVHTLRDSLEESKKFRKELSQDLRRAEEYLGQCLQDKDVIAIECKFKDGVKDENISDVTATLDDLVF